MNPSLTAVHLKLQDPVTTYCLFFFMLAKKGIAVNDSSMMNRSRALGMEGKWGRAKCLLMIN